MLNSLYSNLLPRRKHVRGNDCKVGMKIEIYTQIEVVLPFWNNQVINDIEGVIKAIIYALESNEHD